MKFRLIEKELEFSEVVDAPRKSDWVNVADEGADSIVFVMTASSASTPNTATIQLEASLDKTNVITVGSTVSVSGNGVYSVEKDRPALKWYRISYAIASGSYTANLKVLARGDKD